MFYVEIFSNKEVWETVAEHGNMLNAIVLFKGIVADGKNARIVYEKTGYTYRSGDERAYPERTRSLAGYPGSSAVGRNAKND